MKEKAYGIRVIVEIEDYETQENVEKDYSYFKMSESIIDGVGTDGYNIFISYNPDRDKFSINVNEKR